MKIQMFLLISFVLANNYCVGESQSSCQNICQNYETNFDAFFNKIPSNYEINTNNNTIHNIYIANNVTYYESKHNFIFCNPSIYLIYQDIDSTIKLKNHIYVDSNTILKDAPILFKFNKNLSIEVETDDINNIKPFVLESTNYSKYPYLKIKFLTENFPENLISISSNSHRIRIHDSTPYIKKILSNIEKLEEDKKTYYCLSDKQIKCEKYNTIYNLIEITSIGSIYNYPNYLIVDTSTPIVYYSNCLDTYSHIIAMPGSDITYYPNYQQTDGSYYVILHQDSIEMQNLYVEGEGNFTFATLHNFSMASTTRINDVHFSIKSREPFYWHKSHISALRNDLSIDMIHKIYVPDYSMFYGPSCLQGLFETGKFILEDAFYNVSIDTLKEYDYENTTYYFKRGDHEIPKTWKRPCKFLGLEPSETNFIFSDVYSYDGETIDDFIKVNEYPSNSYSMITIKPALYFYLDSFKDLLNPEFVEKYTIQVDNDIIMTGKCHNNDMDIDEISHDQCRIVGRGTIFFTDKSFMYETKEFCKIDESVNLQMLTLDTQQDLYVCIGQNDIESCKSEIKYADTFRNVEWIWLRNMKTIEIIENRFNKIIKKVFVTDKCLFTEDYIKYDLTLTARSSLTIRYSNYSNYNLYNDNIIISGYRYTHIYAQSNTAKLNIIFHYQYSNFYYYNYIASNIKVFQIYYNDPPTNIDLQFYFNYENVKLYMIYYENFVPESIKLAGKSQIFIREPYKSRVSIFKVPETITFPINPNNDYQQICYADGPVQSSNLNDFVLCSDFESFIKYASYSSPSAYIYKDISLRFNSYYYYSCKSFYLNDSITVSIDLPNNASLSFCDSYYTIVYNKEHYYSFYYSKNDKIIFDVKDYLTLNHVYYSDSYYNYFIPQTSFVSEKESLEIFPGFHLMTLLNVFPNIKVTVPEKFSIYSPAPQYIKGLFGSCPIYYSNSWTYYHYSDEGKALYDSQNSIHFDINQDDDNLPQNIVLAVGNNDVLTLPANWANTHNIFILQNIDDKLDIDKPLNIYYHKYSVTLNEKFRIFVGALNIKLTTNLTIMNASITSDIYVTRYMYDVTLDFSENDHTDLYGGYIYLSYWNYPYVCRFHSDKETNNLTFHTNNQNDMDRWLAIMNTNIKNIILRIDYDTICYNPDAYHFYKCAGDYYRITDFTTLLVAIKSYPELNISVPYNIDIPYSTGDHFKLDPYDESIVIELPYSPESMTVTENQILQFNYSDSSIYEILRKGKIKVNVKSPLKLSIESEFDGDVTFILGSDVFVTSDSIYNGNMKISVESNYHHLYAEEVEKFGNIFGDSLEPYIRMCAYDSDAISLCTFKRKNTIENVFTDPFECNEVEIALSSSSATSPKEIILPPMSYPISVHILKTSSISHMNIKIVSGISISSDLFKINDYWNFDGEIKYISIFYLDGQSSISITDQILTPITFQLTNNETIINLKNCKKQNSPQINILKFGNEMNQITVLGTKEAFRNFNASLVNHDDVSVIWDGTQKYLCLCKDIGSCQRCKEGVDDGLFTTTKKVINDPGEKVKIRVFSDIEVSSDVFTNYHDVYIDPNCMLNLTNTNTVNQNIESGLLVDKLHFVNGSNLILKPTEIAINIEMRTKEMGPYFTIEMDTFLRLNVTNNDDKNINSSRLYVDGHGELNCYDYPFGRIRPGPKVKVIKGVYIVCNSNAGHNFCSYESSVYSYKKLGNSQSFRPDFDPNSKILVFLDSFTSDLEVNLGDIDHQKIEFIRIPFGSKSLLEGKNVLRIISNNSAEITTCSNSTTSLSSSSGGTSIDNSDSDLFVFGVNENLTIKQEGDVLTNSSSITIHPLSEKVTIFIDDSVDIEKQKLKIESENENHVSINVVSKKNITNDDLHKFIDVDDSKVSINIGNQNDESNKKGGLQIGAIIGIVIGAVALVAIVIVIVIFVVRGKRSESYVTSNDDDNNHPELSDSTF